MAGVLTCPLNASAVRCSYLGSSTTQLPSKVSASHRRTRRTCRSIYCTPLFPVQFASSFGSSFGSSFFCFSLGFTLCIPCVNLRFFSFFYFFLTVSSFTFVSAYWQTFVNVYLFILVIITESDESPIWLFFKVKKVLISFILFCHSYNCGITVAVLK